jgi:hypothetical protein
MGPISLMGQLNLAELYFFGGFTREGGSEAGAVRFRHELRIS